jgi:hypothetical protein
MITTADKNKLRVSLSEVLFDWWEDQSSKIQGHIPWLGDDVIDNMAESALLILFSIGNTQDGLDKEGRLVE